MATSTETLNQREVTIEDLKKCSPGKMCAIATMRFKNPLDERTNIVGTFNIFDGVAFGTADIDGVKREIVMQYPLYELVNKTATLLKEKVKQHLKIEEDRDVTVYEILSCYRIIKVLN